MKKISLIVSIAALAAFGVFELAHLPNTGNANTIQSQIATIQSEITKLQDELTNPLGGSVNNPTQITSTTISAALPQPLGTSNSPTFGGATINGNVTSTSGSFTSGFVAFGLSFITGQLQSYYYFPTPAQLAVGTTCGITANVTDAGACLNDIYAAGSLQASSTRINVGAYQYSVSINPNFGTGGQLVDIEGVPGSTRFTDATASGNFFTVNDCQQNSRSRGQATQMNGIGLFATSATSTGGGVTLVYAGGSNGACATNFNNMTFGLSYQNLVVASNTYIFSVTNSMFSNAVQFLHVNAYSNSGEHLSFDNDSFVDPATIASGGLSQASSSIVFDNNGTASTEFGEDSFDNAGVYKGPGNNVTFDNDHFEDSASSIYGTYDYIYSTSSIGSATNLSNDLFLQDATSTSGGTQPQEFITNGDQIQCNNVITQRNGSSATTTIRFIADITGAGSVTCNGFVNSNNAVLRMVDADTLSAGASWGIVTLKSFGFYIVQTAQSLTEFINGNSIKGTLTSAGNWGFGIGGAATTTVYDGGSLGLASTFSGGNQTLTATTPSVQIDNNSTFATDTLPAINACQGCIEIFKSRGTSSTNILASTIAPDFIWLLTPNASATNYVNGPGSSTAFYDDGTYWDQLWK